MGRLPVFSAEAKARTVLSVLLGKVTAAEAPLEEEVSEEAICQWEPGYRQLPVRVLLVQGVGVLWGEQGCVVSVEADHRAFGDDAPAALGDFPRAHEVGVVVRGVRAAGSYCHQCQG